jgi:predicted DNA-binding protein
MNITLPESISDELNQVSEELQTKKSHIISKALELYFDELDLQIAEKRLKEAKENKDELIPAEKVWRELGIE